MFELDFKKLTDTRIQLHWASQLLSAAADSRLPRAEDDSHSNLGWNGESNRLESRADVSLDVIGFSVGHGDDSFSLSGKTLAEGANWLSAKLQAEIQFRDYEMPKSPIQNGGCFSPDLEQLASVAELFSFAQRTFGDCGELRVWPHHFDLGFWRQTDVEGKSIGGGFILGDPHYDQPYFYINPYGIDRPDNLPELSHGHWTEHWLGAVLSADDLKRGDAQQIANRFVTQAIDRCKELLV